MEILCYNILGNILTTGGCKVKKLFMPYYSVIVTLGLLITANSFILEAKDVRVSLSFLLVFLMTNLSESVYYFFTKEVTMTLSSAITIFATLILPFPLVILIIFGFTILGKVTGVLRKELKKIFDMKWLFNFTSFVILAKLSSSIASILDFEFLSGVDQVIVIVGICMVHNLLNVVFTYTVISLSIGENVFKDYRLTEYLIFTFYNIMFTMMLWFGFSSYGNLGLGFMAMMIVPLQRSIIMQTKSTEISKMLIEDPLTKARNRQSFEDTIYEKLDKQMAFSMIFLDLDKFKSINDTYGHLIGDDVLVDFVSRVKEFLRPDDYIFRYGGDEFCIVIYDLGYGDILFRLLKKNIEHFSLKCHQGHINYRYSMSIIEYDGLSRESYRNIMQRADKAMYKRKHAI